MCVCVWMGYIDESHSYVWVMNNISPSLFNQTKAYTRMHPLASRKAWVLYNTPIHTNPVLRFNIVMDLMCNGGECTGAMHVKRNKVNNFLDNKTSKSDFKRVGAVSLQFFFPRVYFYLIVLYYIRWLLPCSSLFCLEHFKQFFLRPVRMEEVP